MEFFAVAVFAGVVIIVDLHFGLVSGFLWKMKDQRNWKKQARRNLTLAENRLRWAMGVVDKGSPESHHRVNSAVDSYRDGRACFDAGSWSGAAVHFDNTVVQLNELGYPPGIETIKWVLFHLDGVLAEKQ